MGTTSTKFFATVTTILVGLAMNLCVCARSAGPGSRALAEAVEQADPHACCKTAGSSRTDDPVPAEPADPCESCPVKQKLGGMLPDQISKLNPHFDAVMVHWPDPLPAALVDCGNKPAVFGGDPAPPLLLDLFHTSCQLSC